MTTRSERPVSIDLALDTARLGESLSRAAGIFERDLAVPAARSGDLLAASFERVFARLESAITKAARTGEFSLKSMVNAIIADLSRLAFERFVAKPITSAIESLVGGLFPFLGGRAAGGPVVGGGAYVVGERGPEVFVPSQAGRIIAAGATGRPAPVHIHLHTPDVAGLSRSEGQVTAMLARAVRRGTRSL